ncbi:MAG TPA: hypothetical protein VFC89_02825, partial [Oscillospiraceae bacterium]|nr:hypothetical protein [Oscillospiraceae bacterium]
MAPFKIKQLMRTTRYAEAATITILFLDFNNFIFIKKNRIRKTTVAAEQAVFSRTAFLYRGTQFNRNYIFID